MTYQIEFSDEPSIEEQYDRKMLPRLIATYLTRLHPREQKIVICRFGLGCLPMSRRAVGDQYSLSIQRVRQIEQNAMRKLKHIMAQRRKGLWL